MVMILAATVDGFVSNSLQIEFSIGIADVDVSTASVPSEAAGGRVLTIFSISILN